MAKFKDNGFVKSGERYRLKKPLLISKDLFLPADSLVSVFTIGKDKFKIQDNFRGFKFSIKNSEKAEFLKEFS